MNHSKNPCGRPHEVSTIFAVIIGYRQVCILERRYEVMTEALKSQMKKREDVGVVGFHHVGANCLGDDSRMICCESQREVGQVVLDSFPKKSEEVILYLDMKTPDLAKFAETLITISDLDKNLRCKQST
jgi:hypothetical protein